MTHITGPRKEKVEWLAILFIRAIRKSDCTISEAQEALHEADVALLKSALRPLEQFTCPTCPQPGDLTMEQMGKIESAIRKAMDVKDAR